MRAFRSSSLIDLDEETLSLIVSYDKLDTRGDLRRVPSWAGG